jgi:hypothetical protein
VSDSDIARVEVKDQAVAVKRAVGDIDLDNLTGEVSESGGYALWWAHLKAKAEGEVERMDLALDVLSAKKAKEFRIKQQRADAKTTEPMVAEFLMLDEDVMAAKVALIDAKEKASLVRAAYDAAQQKSRTLQNLTFLIGAEVGANHDPLRTRMREDAKKIERRRPV